MHGEFEPECEEASADIFVRSMSCLSNTWGAMYANGSKDVGSKYNTTSVRDTEVHANGDPKGRGRFDRT